MVRAARFRLSKYYLDCVSEAGTLCIGYVARLSWGPLVVRYASLLESRPDGSTRERHTYARVPPPVEGSRGLEWQCDALGVKGTWENATASHEATLLADGPGGIHWRALAPRAEARIETAGESPVVGWGYAEHLELTVEPWRLPFDTLHWGRFHSPDAALVWIGWDGDVALRHVVLNGQLLGDASFGQQVLSFPPGHELRLGDTRTVHDAPVTAAVERLPRVLRRVPPAFMAAREVKWLSQAQLWSGGRPQASGWALHERVQFR